MACKWTLFNEGINILVKGQTYLHKFVASKHKTYLKLFLLFIVPEGGECTPNPCGPNSGCRVIQGHPQCFCLPEFEGNPPSKPCTVPSHPCEPSPCGPNTQCAILSNGFAKCTCLPGYLESPNTIRGCVEKRNPCQPNTCGPGAICDPNRQPACLCPDPLVGNPYKHCAREYFNHF